MNLRLFLWSAFAFNAFFVIFNIACIVNEGGRPVFFIGLVVNGIGSISLLNTLVKLK